VGSAGGSGAAPHLRWCRQIVEEIAREHRLTFTLGIISSDVGKETVKAALDAGRIAALPFVPPLTARDIEESTHIVAQIGHEPLAAALGKGCGVVLAGRCYDPAVFAALPVMQGYPIGLALHMGKILECGAIAATPGSGADCALGTLYDDRFVLEALSPKRRFTRESAAAHTLYEKSDPYRLPGPGGIIDLTRCEFAERGEGRVEVRGSIHEAAPAYMVKLEGARRIGSRAISIAGTRDPIMIRQVDSILAAVEAQVRSMSAAAFRGDLHFHVYGRDGVMGPTEPVRTTSSHELGIVIEAISPTQEEADSLVSVTRSTLLHFGYPGRISTAGNLAFPFSPSDIRMGDVYGFSIYHLMEIEDPAGFPLEIVSIRQGEAEK
jgi:hypothetical protein